MGDETVPLRGPAGGRRTAFAAGTLVVVSLAGPREKFWGALLELSTAGLSLRGIDLDSFDGFVSLLRSGEAAAPMEVFFPMHRIERVEADLPSGIIPSLSERFQTGTGRSAASLLYPDQTRSVPQR